MTRLAPIAATVPTTPRQQPGSPMSVTVITVCFNSARTIVDALRSVQSQTHAALEHIVIDGASRDGTAQLVREHGHRVARFVSEPDHGIYDAMNKGLALASGEFVGFLNADDVFADDGVVARIAAAASSPSHPDAVFGDLVYVDAQDMTRVVRRWRSGRFASSRLRFGWMPPHPTFYARTEQLRRLGGFDTGYRIAADYDCMLRVLSRPGATAAYLDEVLVRMRTGGASNRSLSAVLRKSREDLRTLRRSGVGGLFTLGCKNLRKLPQLWRHA
jgi:glycosyltransferase